ncbi:hypothetical protein PHMEG_00029744 [Phytophthora megakarya]|uniref:ZNF380 coiled-coil domain-containing protein n=1 Tax=Phytophthora megakarya TaxID=4795 RepID=A0A225V4E4_9STRA|nr:hypothetical protein PHMEG_00029744 [Phytophthora megakarya]
MKEATPNGSATRSTLRREPSARKAVIPLGFFDDSFSDAKARQVDVQQLAQKQLESEWEAFQEFAAEVEQKSAQEEKEQVEATKEREAVEQLDNMQYVDRYRVALERVTSLRNGHKEQTEKRKVDAVLGDDTDSSKAVEAAVNKFKKQKKRKRQRVEEDSDDFDPCNWRSRGI